MLIQINTATLKTFTPINAADLTARNLSMQRDCQDSQKWEMLANEYESRGMLYNAVRCRQRAEYYRENK
jgi:hypothetical protein